MDRRLRLKRGGMLGLLAADCVEGHKGKPTNPIPGVRGVFIQPWRFFSTLPDLF